jgi:cholesterol oxidase
MGTPLDVKEWMKGYIGFGAADSDAGYIQGLAEGTPFMHEVTIHIDDIDRFVAEPKHAAKMEGYVDCPRFGGKCPFQDGIFNMLVDTNNPSLKIMLYRIPFVDTKGNRHTMLGHKTLHSDKALDLLSDIMRLTVRIFAGDVEGPDVATTGMGPANTPAITEAIGVIQIQTLDGLRSAASFVSPGAGTIDSFKAIAKFGEFYLDRLWDVYVKADHPELGG